MDFVFYIMHLWYNKPLCFIKLIKLYFNFMRVCTELIQTVQTKINIFQQFLEQTPIPYFFEIHSDDIFEQMNSTSSLCVHMYTF
jgi:hypothetical protein